MKQHDWKELVPVTKQGAVERALAHTFGSVEVDDIEPLTGGRSSALVYKVTANQKPYVMRLVLQTDDLRDPARHFTAMNAAAKAAIAPPVRYTNAEDAISIVDFIEHGPLRPAFASEKEMFVELATSIKAIHALPLFPKLVDFLDGVGSLIGVFQSSQLLPASATEEHFRHYAEVQRVYPRHEENLVSSHNDLNPTNILHDGRKLWIIDWEVAFANDCYLDLASVNLFFGSGERGEEALLGTYFGAALNEYHRARFFLKQQACFFYVAMVFMHLVSVTRRSDTILDQDMATMSLFDFQCGLRSGEITLTSAEEYLLHAKVLLNESLAQMKTARFGEAIRLLESTPQPL